MQLKAVLFDLDDTLYTSWDECDNAGSQAVGAYAARELHLDSAEFVTLFMRSRAALMRALPNVADCHDRLLAAQRALETLGLNPIVPAEAMFEA